MSEKYQVSSSPHVRAKDSTSRVMLYVIIALLPATLFGIWNFGMHALLLILVTIASCLASEWIFDKIVHKKNSLPDLSAVVTGLLLALNLPAGLPWWEAVIGSVFAIVIVKMMFGGLGQNFMNPALGGRCFLLIAFAADMTNFKSSKFEAYSGATPLAMIRNEGLSSVNVMDMLTGKIPGPWTCRMSSHPRSSPRGLHLLSCFLKIRLCLPRDPWLPCGHCSNGSLFRTIH